jgi:hypothetical protein
MDTNYDLPDKCRKYKRVFTLIEIMESAIVRFYGNRNLLKRLPRPRNRKPNEDLMEYQRDEPAIITRRYEYDRHFSLETVALQTHRTEHDADIEKVTVHTGGFADELARQMNALAVTIATDIYFRGNKYNPTSEEGRKLLAHELTHVAQYTEGRIDKAETREELESEATGEEQTEEYDPDPYVAARIEGKVFTFRKSQMDKIAEKAARDALMWLESRKVLLSEEKYLKLLCAYEEWLKEVI